MKHRIIATHMGGGEVEFVLEAEDSAKAFTKWKQQVVANPRQWNVRSNVAVGSSSFLTQFSIREDEHNDGSNADITSPTDAELQDA
jgi:type II secretory pathway component PulK